MQSPSPGWSLRRLHAVSGDHINGLATILMDCVEGGASVGGTVQLILDQPGNQPHRADLSKMLVHRRARRSGLGAALMHAAEAAARECGKSLLVLDTASGDAERLYERMGWTRAGVIPGFALMPNGDVCDTTVYYRALNDQAAAGG